jgi:hypothetical protein
MKKLLTFLILTLFMGVVFGQGTKSSIYGNMYVIKTTSPTIFIQGSGGVLDFYYGSSHIKLTQGSGVLTLSGGDFAIGANNLLMTGSIGSTGSRITKGWFTDAEFTNTPTIGGVALSSLYATSVQLAAITPTSLGLGNVTNISATTMLNNTALTGVPTAATASVGTNTTQVATTAFVLANGGGGGGAGTWGSIIGTLSAQTDLQNALNAKLTTNGSAASLTNFPTLNQSTTGSAAKWTTARTIWGNSIDGSGNITSIIASTYGGTGNGFTKFTGPTTTEKTFTLPNASATVLTDNASVTVAQGGTGRATGTTAYGLIAAGTTATGTQQTLPTGLSGQVLISGGSGALPSFSTATYPSVSSTARKILVSDGTNLVMSTETYDTPGAAGNILVSDGTNQVSTTPVDISTLGFVKYLPDTVQYTNPFTLQASDINKWIGVNKATSVAITLPPDASVTIPIGTTMNFIQEGVGIMVFKVGTGVHLFSLKDSIASDGINSWVGVYKWATNKYRIYGNIGQ